MTFLKMRNIFTVAVCAISFWLVFTAYNYFFDKNKPLIILENLENDKYYAGNLACKITGSDSYGVSYLCVSLDDKPFVDKFRLGNKKTFNYDLSLDTLSIPDGKHSLKIEATDGTFRHNNKIREDLISKFITKFNLNKSFSDLLNLLILNKRIFILSKVLDYIIILYQEDTKNYIFDISSPEDISKNNLNFLVNYLEKKLNIKVDYNLNINKKLIAGIRAESCNNLWDSSIQGKLQKMLIELVN